MRVQTNSYKQLPVQPIISQFDRLATILGDDLKVKFLKRFENWSGRIEDYFKGENILKVSSRFIQDAVALRTNAGKIVCDLGKQFLKGLTEEQWKESLINEDQKINLIFDLIGASVSPMLSGNFRTALLHHSDDVISGEIWPEDFLGNWHTLPNALQSNSRTAYFNDLLTLLLTRVLEPNVIRDTIRLYEPEFSETAGFVDRADDVIRRILCPLIHECEESGLDWIDEQIELLKKCVAKASRDNRGYLKETIISVLERDDTDSERIRALAKSFKVRLPSK